ncbi:YigZ family protein [Abyssisolibacter fermentans]|uniref:YigZ family protein n=1 Tax=Abyssisolibacter fermentans TaxID=1766203 RepID=UPI00082E43E0|nr:YigZ family protein [Abyssisolibacter fermentans]
MKNRFYTINDYGYDEIIINKSRFIGYAKPANTEQEAIDFIEEIKTKHKDATHNVYGYVIGENSNIQRFSDDGEPSGTAGIPVLEVIKKENLRNTVVVVTRYFGGIKLGAGGLIRAYTKGAKIGIESAVIVEKVLYKKILFRINYSLLGKVKNELLRLNYYIEDITYDDAVNIFVLCDINDVDRLKNNVIDVTNAQVDISEIDEQYVSVKDGKMI